MVKNMHRIEPAYYLMLFSYSVVLLTVLKQQFRSWYDKGLRQMRNVNKLYFNTLLTEISLNTNVITLNFHILMR